MTPLRSRIEDRRAAVVMGVLNKTPDSFSDGGRFAADDAAIARGEEMMREGADVIDVGAESTRPRAPIVSPKEQIARLGGVVRALAKRGALVSIDTTSPEVAEFALGEGARVVNSVSLEPAKELAELARRYEASLVLMHSRGSMSEMKGFSNYPDDGYGDVVADVKREWLEAARRALDTGLPRRDLVFDPGLGFAKNARHSLELCARLDELVALGHPVLVGASRKSFVARAAAASLDAPLSELAEPNDRLGGSLVVALACVAKGAAIVRAHDVAATKQALAVAERLRTMEEARRA